MKNSLNGKCIRKIGGYQGENKQEKGYRDGPRAAGRFWSLSGNPAEAEEEIETDEKSPDQKAGLIFCDISENRKIGGQPVAASQKPEGVGGDQDTGDESKKHGRPPKNR